VARTQVYDLQVVRLVRVPDHREAVLRIGMQALFHDLGITPVRLDAA